ncbi:MAG TPA: hypothetical protein VKT81_23075 [Bryobacteraceae bacterium]|nr:hypothetical protein [Bryobacteraceae bacterium]
MNPPRARQTLPLLVLGAAALLHAADPAPFFAEIGKIEAGLAEITGLHFTHPVPYGVLNKDQLRAFLEQRIKKTLKPDDIRAEELTLKMLGLIPPDFDLRQNTVDLLTEQAAAFYDYNKKKLFVLEGSGGGLEERTALVHELAHALADQHFHLGKYIQEGARSDDGSTARLAVMEGQATWLMTAYLAKQDGEPAEVPDRALELMTESIQSSARDYPVFSKAPRYIRESLVFPYAAGMLFQNAVFRKQGRDSFSEVFTHPPLSTQQIMHPDLYLEHHAPQNPPVPKPPDHRAFRTLAEGNLGEFDYKVLLTEYTSEEQAKSTAAHLAGSSYALLEHKHEKYPVLVYASTWDSPKSAQEYFDLYAKILHGKWKTIEMQSETSMELSGHADQGYFRTWRDGQTVNHIEGLKTPANP